MDNPRPVYREVTKHSQFTQPQNKNMLRNLDIAIGELCENFGTAHSENLETMQNLYAMLSNVLKKISPPNSLESRLDKIESRLTDLSEGIQSLNTRLDNLSQPNFSAEFKYIEDTQHEIFTKMHIIIDKLSEFDVEVPKDWVSDAEEDE